MYLDVNLNSFPKEILIKIIEHQQDLLFDKERDDIDGAVLKQQIQQVFGGQRKLAHLLGISQGCLSQWCRGKHIPRYRKDQITELSKGKINFHLITKENNLIIKERNMKE